MAIRDTEREDRRGTGILSVSPIEDYRSGFDDKKFIELQFDTFFFLFSFSVDWLDLDVVVE